MIRAIQESDREFYCAVAKLFYQSPAVLAPIPADYITKTFDLILSGTPFASGYIIEAEGKRAGYALLAHTWSQEAGGEVLWIEEIFLLPEYRSRGLGKEFFAFLEANFAKKTKRFRLEVEKENESAVRFYKSLGFDFFEYDQMKKEF